MRSSIEHNARRDPFPPRGFVLPLDSPSRYPIGYRHGKSRADAHLLELPARVVPAKAGAAQGLPEMPSAIQGGMMVTEEIPESEWNTMFPPPTSAQLDETAPCRFCNHPKASHDASMPGTDN